MEPIITTLNGIFKFAYDNILSIAMIILIIATGVFISIKTGFSSSGNLAMC